MLCYVILVGWGHVIDVPFYPRDDMLARVFARATCLSVCVSVTRRYFVMISSPSGSPTILVFWCQISSQNSKGVTPSGASNRGWVGKNQQFSISIFNPEYFENGSGYGKTYN